MNLIQDIRNAIRPNFEHDASGHDWHHIERVYRNAMYIQSKEGGDAEVVALAALLHDISDHKLNGGLLNQGGKVASQILAEYGAPDALISQVAYIVDHVSYKGAGTSSDIGTLEGKIVQDADRLDAIGAIGIARTFAYGGHKGQSMYDPDHQVQLHSTFDEYVSGRTTTINHFYEKLLLLTDRLHTATAQELARERHVFMEQFLQEFYAEWNFNSAH